MPELSIVRILDEAGRPGRVMLKFEPRVGGWRVRPKLLAVEFRRMTEPASKLAAVLVLDWKTNLVEALT
jgi:hypothetical protein